jgi:hypothetical protein
MQLRLYDFREAPIDRINMTNWFVVFPGNSNSLQFSVVLIRTSIVSLTLWSIIYFIDDVPPLTSFDRM